MVIIVIITIILKSGKAGRCKMNACTEIPVAKMKSGLSDFIANVTHGHRSFIITSHSRPVAALVNMENFRMIEQVKEKKGLYEIAGKWRSFDEIRTHVANARRKKGNGGRHVSL
jgi:prevent-host-death family protein